VRRLAFLEGSGRSLSRGARFATTTGVVENEGSVEEKEGAAAGGRAGFNRT